MPPKADRRGTDANLASLSTRVDAIEGRMDSFEIDLRTNTRLTEEIHKDTSALVEFTKFAKTGMKYGSAIAAALATVGGIGKVFGAW